jgi:hypothetical protein
MQSVLIVSDEALSVQLSDRLVCIAEVSEAQLPSHLGSVIKLSNKYYEADVCLLPRAFTSLGETLLSTKKTHKIEGIILVAPEGCTRAQRRLEELCPIEAGADIRILVVDTPPTTTSGPSAGSHADWEDRMRGCCIEHCTEYCEVCTADAEADEALSQQEEPQGVRRVLEALDTHIWPDMQMRNTAQTHQQPRGFGGEAAERGAHGASAPGGAGRDDGARERAALTDRAPQRADAGSRTVGSNNEIPEVAQDEHLVQGQAQEDLLREMQGACAQQVTLVGPHMGAALWPRETLWRARSTGHGSVKTSRCLAA